MRSVPRKRVRRPASPRARSEGTLLRHVKTGCLVAASACGPFHAERANATPADKRTPTAITSDWHQHIAAVRSGVFVKRGTSGN